MNKNNLFGRFVKFFTALILVAFLPISLVSCGAKKAEHSPVENANSKDEYVSEVQWSGYKKAEIPNELFPFVKFDPIEFDAIKKAQTTFAKKYDSDNNLILSNDYVEFHFMNTVLNSILKTDEEAIILATKAMEQVNLTTLRHFFKNPLVIGVSNIIRHRSQGVYFDNGNTVDITLAKSLDKWNLEETAYTVNHEIGHFETMSNFNSTSPIAKYFSESDFNRKFDSFLKDLNNKYLYERFNNIDVENSLLSHKKSEWELRSEKNSKFASASFERNIQANRERVDCIKFSNWAWNQVFAKDFLTKIYNWFPLEKFNFLKNLNPSVYTSWDVYMNSDSSFLLPEFITRFQLTQTQLVDPDVLFEKDQSMEGVGEKLSKVFMNQNEAMSLSGMNLHDENDGLQSYRFMKSIFKNFYGVGNVNSISFERDKDVISQAFFNSIGSEKTSDISKIVISDKANNISIVKKVNHERVALGFNRNPFTPYEYKYVADAAYTSIFDDDIDHDLLTKIEPKNLSVDLIDNNGQIINDPNLNISLNDSALKNGQEYYDFSKNKWRNIEMSSNEIYTFNK